MAGKWYINFSKIIYVSLLTNIFKVSASVLCGAVGDNSSYVISETDETVTIVNHGIPQNV